VCAGIGFRSKPVKRAKWIFYILYVAYPFACPKIASIFICRDVAGTSYLEADYTIHCGTGEWYGYSVYAGILMAIYVVGFPLAALLFVKFKGGSTEHRERYSFFFADFKVEGISRFWEVIELVRKLVLSTFLSFFRKHSVLQIATALLIMTFAICAQAAFSPFKARLNNRLQLFALGVLWMTYYSGILLKVRSVSAGNGLGVLLTIMMSSVVVATVITGYLGARKFKAGWTEARAAKAGRKLSIWDEVNDSYRRVIACCARCACCARRQAGSPSGEPSKDAQAQHTGGCDEKQGETSGVELPRHEVHENPAFAEGLHDVGT
jgi:hypothetical protein